MFTVNGTEERQQRAMRKAQDERPVVATVVLGSYRVEGSGGNFYDVTVAGDAVNCNCMAGRNDKPCYHAFAALRRHENESALAAVAAPAPRSKHLGHIESDLRHIMRLVEQVEGNYELAEAIFRTARAARESLAEYELELRPATDAAAAA